MTDAAQKKTPLYDEHVRLGAKIIPFGGWLMPVQYSSIMEEHRAVRNNVGVFDISHMGELVATGARAGDRSPDSARTPRGCRCASRASAHAR